MKKLLLVFLTSFLGLVGNAQWTANSLPGPGLGREVFMVSSTTGFLTTMNQNGSVLDAYMYKTTNGGTTWSSVKTLVGTDLVFPYQSFGLEDFDFPSSSVGYCAGVNYVYGFLAKTTDGGTTWDTTTYTGITEGFDCVDFTDANTGYFGGGGSIFKTTDGGTTITSIHSSGTGQVYDIAFVNSTTGFAVTTMNTSTNQSYILKTVNAGASWTTVHSSSNANITSISMVDLTTGYAISNNAKLYKTTNGGTSWVESSPFTGLSGSWEIHAVNSNIIYASGVTSGFSRVILKSTNGGTSWTTDYTEISVTPFYNFTFFGSVAMAISPDNYVKTTSAPLTVEDSQLNFEVTIYPNPAQSVLNLDIPADIQITNLKVYDPTAKLVIDESENFNQLNIENLPSGIYLLNIENAGELLYSTKFIKE